MIQKFIPLTFVAFAISSCEESKINSCGTSSPLEDLSWLKEKVENIEKSNSAASAEIIQYFYHNATVFWNDTCVGCADGLATVHNCEGEITCKVGGIDGRNTCPDFQEHATDKSFLYSTSCEKLVQPDATKYDQETDFYNISSVKIEGDCLEMEFSASGCSGSSWTWELYDQEVVMEFFPIQRNIKLVLDNKEACLAVFTQTTSFDLSPIQTSTYEEIRLNLEGWGEQLSYTY